MTGDEEWIWLFSDDDIMGRTCVEDFYGALEKSPGYDLYHFNVAQINENNSIIEKPVLFPPVLSHTQFIMSRLNGSFHSFVVEYIFNKSVFIAKWPF